MRRSKTSKNIRRDISSSTRKSRTRSSNSNNSDQGYGTAQSTPEGSPKSEKKYLTLTGSLGETETDNITNINLEVETKDDKYNCKLKYKKDKTVSISFSLDFSENIEDLLEQLKEDEANPGFTDDDFDNIKEQFYDKIEPIKPSDSVVRASKTWRARTQLSRLSRMANTSYRRTSRLNRIKNTMSLDFEYFINPDIFYNIDLISNPEASSSGSIVYKFSTKGKTKYNLILKITMLGENIEENDDALIEYEHYKNMTLLIQKNITPYVFRNIDKLGPFRGDQLDLENKKKLVKQFKFDFNNKSLDKTINSNYFFAMLNETGAEGEVIPFMSFLKKYYKNPQLKEIIFNLLFQILYTLECFNRMSMKHNDLHLSNIMVILKKKNLTNSKSYDKFCRKFIYTDKKGKKKSLFLPNIGIEVRIFDFDRSCKYKKTKLSQKIYSKFVEKNTHQNCEENKYSDTYRVLYNLYKFFNDIVSNTRNNKKNNINIISNLIYFIKSCFNNQKLLIYGLNKKNKFLNLREKTMRFGILKSKPYRGEMLKTNEILLKIIDELALETKISGVNVLETYDIRKIVEM